MGVRSVSEAEVGAAALALRCYARGPLGRWLADVRRALELAAVAAEAEGRADAEAAERALADIASGRDRLVSGGELQEKLPVLGIEDRRAEVLERLAALGADPETAVKVTRRGSGKTGKATAAADPKLPVEVSAAARRLAAFQRERTRKP